MEKNTNISPTTLYSQFECFCFEKKFFISLYELFILVPLTPRSTLYKSKPAENVNIQMNKKFQLLYEIIITCLYVIIYPLKIFFCIQKEITNRHTLTHNETGELKLKYMCEC